MIVLDLEWNRSYDRKALDEILQIGAVRVAGPGGRIQDTFNVFIRPCVHRGYDQGAKKLPDLRASLESDVTFREAWAAFRDWCGGEDEFGFWGMDDFDTLRANCDYWRLPHITPKRRYNFQAAFARACGAEGVQTALFRAVEYCGIPDIFDYHNALSDALYTALIGEYLRPEDFQEARDFHVGRAKKESADHRSEVPVRQFGPFPSRAAALADRRCRTAHCPVCGKALRVERWYGLDHGRNLALVRCPRHGEFLCRLRLRLNGGAWLARQTVPHSDEQLREAYQRAVELARGKPPPPPAPPPAEEAAPAPEKKRRRRRRRRRRPSERPQGEAI